MILLEFIKARPVVQQSVEIVEHRLNSEEFKKRFPETGEDVKVMGLRMKNTLDLTVAMPLLTRYIASVREYFDRKQVIYEAMSEKVEETVAHAFQNISSFCGELVHGKYRIC